MRHWAIYTVLLYALALVVLTVPVIAIAFGSWAGLNVHYGIGQAAGMLLHWEYWLWLAIMLTGQALLLLLPLKITERRFIARRTLILPCIVTAFLLANLFFAGILDILCFTLGDDVPKFYNLDFSNSSNLGAVLTAIITVLAFWLFWTIIFRHFADSDDPDTLLKRIVRWLLAGSILELLIAVPSHIFVRRREDCCAPFGTFWGIATGISIMLLCFGPGVFYLFIKRIQRLQPPEKPVDPHGDAF